MSIYNKEFSRAMATFQPEFGNEKHIRAGKYLKELSILDKKLEQKIGEQATTKKIMEDMKANIRQIVYLLKKEEKKVDNSVDNIYKKWITIKK